jgi:5,10-methylenetetrahydromethanopterin reductase
MTPNVTFGFLALGSLPPARFVALVKDAEALRFETFWAADERFFRDCWAQLAVATQYSATMRLGTAVTDPYIRHPALTAVSVATIDELSGGRAILGLGMGGSGFRQLGLKKERPLTVLREAIELIRALLQGDNVDYKGRAFTFNGRLSTAAAPHVPMMVATNGVQVMGLAGEVADIVMVQGLASTHMVEVVLEHIDAGARKVGRARPKLIARLDTVVSGDRNLVRAATLPGLTRHLRVHYPEFKSQALAGLRVGDELRDAIGKLTYSFDPADLSAAGSLISDDFIDRLCLAGTPAEIERHVRELAKAGVDQITVFPVSAPDQIDLQSQTIDAIAKEVIPRFAA